MFDCFVAIVICISFDFFEEKIRQWCSLASGNKNI